MRRLLPGSLLFVSTVLATVAADVTLFEKEGPFGWVIVTENNGLRTLQFERGGARQTVVKPGDPAHLELPYAPVALTGLSACEAPRRVLIVGLGGGTLPMFIRHYYPEAVIDGVDINPDVVDVARRFLGFREDARMRGIVADGRKFIEDTREPYDVIFLDAFGADSVPPPLSTVEFLRAVRKALKPSGVAVGNIWSREYNRLYDSMVRTYQEAFDDLYLLEVRGVGNRILLSLPRKENFTRADLTARAGTLSREKGFRFDMAPLVRTGFNHLRERDASAHVLTDAGMLKK
ncbi:MAG: spermidine synthase [Opitutaceae bacterium]